MNELDQLYQQVILDHSRERHGSGALEAPDATSHQVNPTCGDDVTLGVRVKDGKIEAIGWEGDGCSISQASISVMHDLVNGADLATVARLEADFDTLMHSRGKGVDDTILDDLEDGAAFEGVSKYPNRVKCALLGWMALKDALAKSGVALPAVEHLRHEALTGRVTLLFAGHDHVHCHARVLREAVLGVEEDLT